MQDDLQQYIDAKGIKSFLGEFTQQLLAQRPEDPKVWLSDFLQRSSNGNSTTAPSQVTPRAPLGALQGNRSPASPCTPQQKETMLPQRPASAAGRSSRPTPTATTVAASPAPPSKASPPGAAAAPLLDAKVAKEAFAADGVTLNVGFVRLASGEVIEADSAASCDVRN